MMWERSPQGVWYRELARSQTKRIVKRKRKVHHTHMARRSNRRALALYRPSPKPIVIRTTKMVKAKHHRKHGRGKGGFAEKHRIGAIVGGGVLGLIDKSGVDLPSLPFLGKAGTLGVAAWAIGRYMRSPWAEDLATGFLSIAAYELAKEGSISGIEGGYVAGGL